MKTGKALTVIITTIIALSLFLAPCTNSKNATIKENGTPAGWGNDINLSETRQNHLETSLAVNQENVHVVWRYNAGATKDILYRKSTNEGRSWGPKITLGSSSDLVTFPDIDLSNNHIHVVWSDYMGWNGIYYRNSTDNGENWNPIKRISSDGVDAYTPHVFVNNSNIHIIWGDTRDGSDGEIYYRRSLDDGVSFDNGQGIDTDRRITFSPSTIGAVNIAGSGSNISVIWYDERNGYFQIYWMISKDNGNTWEDGLGNINADRRISDSNIDCGGAAIAMTGTNIYIIWPEQIWPGPTYCLYYRNSSDMGATWGDIQLLAGPTPLIWNPDITISGNNIHVVWDDARDDGTHEEIYYKNSTDGGITWGSDLRLTFNNTEWSDCPKIAVQNDTRHIVWYNWYGSNLRDVFYKRYPGFPPLPSYKIPVVAGWNLISSPLAPTSSSLPDALLDNDGDTAWDRMQWYDPYDAANHWKQYNTGWNASLNDLSGFNASMGIWVNITSIGDGFLNLSGEIPTSTSIPLRTGWNMVGYPSLNDSTVGVALWGTGATMVEVFNVNATYRTKVVGPNYVMKPGEGYWVYVPADTVWTVDW